MKKGLAVAIFAAAAALFVGCKESKPVLHLYNWSDYVKPEVVERFENEFNCKVVTDTFDSNESMFAKLKAGATGYDIIFPSTYFVEIMRDQGLIQAIDTSRIPNLTNIDEKYNGIITDPTFKTSVPYMISFAGIAYIKDRCADFEPSWNMFSRDQYKGRITMLNDMRETIGAALKVLGYSMNTTNAEEIAKASDLIISWKKNLAKFDNEQYKNGIASGEFIFVHGYNGDLGQIIENNPNVVFAYPQEGVSMCCDEMVISRDAKNLDLAYAFINFMHDPKIAAENIEFTCYLCPNKAAYALLPAEVREDENIFIPENISVKSEAIHDLGVNNKLYTDAWDRIKATDSK